MPVPKQKQGRIRTHTRRSANMKISAAAQSTCPRCGAVKLPQLRFLQGPRGYRYRVTVYSGCDAVPNGTTMAGSMSRPFLYKEHVYE